MTDPIAHVVLQGTDRADTRSARVATVAGIVVAAYVITVVIANWASTATPGSSDHNHEDRYRILAHQ